RGRHNARPARAGRGVGGVEPAVLGALPDDHAAGGAGGDSIAAATAAAAHEPNGPHARRLDLVDVHRAHVAWVTPDVEEDNADLAVFAGRAPANVGVAHPERRRARAAQPIRPTVIDPHPVETVSHSRRVQLDVDLD